MPKAGTAANLASSGVRSIVVAARAALQLGAASGTRASDGCRLQPTSRRMRRRACCWPCRRTHLTKVMAGRVHGRTRWAGPFRRRHGHSTDVGPALGFQAHGAHCRQRCIDGGAHFARPVCIGHGGVRIRFENERVLTPPLDLLWEVNSTHTPPPVERALYNPIHKPEASTRRWATQKVRSRTKIRRAASLPLEWRAYQRPTRAQLWRPPILMMEEKHGHGVRQLGAAVISTGTHAQPAAFHEP